MPHVLVRFLLLLSGVFLLTGCAEERVTVPEQEPDAEWLHASMKRITDVMVHDIFSPPHASRTYAYASIAAYEALQHDHAAYKSLAGQLNGLAPTPAPEGDVYLPLSSVQAMLAVGKALVFSEAGIDTFRTDLVTSLKDELRLDERVYRNSVAYGDTVAQHILAWAEGDLYKETRSYPKFTVLDEPGRWQPTPPAYMDGIEPHWRELRPFVMERPDQFAPPPPKPFDMTEGSPFYEETREVYEVGANLSAEERAIAAFWDCNPYVMHTRGHVMFATKKITPGGHWVGIAAIAARQTGADVMQAAETYARVSVALADAFIASWDEKYRSTLIRPETVINKYIDETWVPALQTPPFPEYTSGHSVISMAAAEVLTDLYGDDFAFDDTTEVEYGLPVRSFASFEEAAQEAAISRMYGGIHYRMAIENGVDQGRSVGRHVIASVASREPALATSSPR